MRAWLPFLRPYVPRAVNFDMRMDKSAPIVLNILSRCLFQNY